MNNLDEEQCIFVINIDETDIVPSVKMPMQFQTIENEIYKVEPGVPAASFNPKTYNCVFCDDIFDKEGDLANHIDNWHHIHVGSRSNEETSEFNYRKCSQKSYECYHTNCQSSFKKYYELRLHMLTHSGERPLKGEHDDLRDRRDMKAHDDKKVYKGKLKSNFEHYVLIHDDERLFKCEYKNCSRSFKSNNHLISHMRFHTDQNRFKCGYKYCSSSFKLKNHLARHMRLHEDETLFECEGKDTPKNDGKMDL